MNRLISVSACNAHDVHGSWYLCWRIKSRPPHAGNPVGGLAQGSDGVFYGAGHGGVGKGLYGTGFRITAAGQERVLWYFSDYSSDLGSYQLHPQTQNPGGLQSQRASTENGEFVRRAPPWMWLGSHFSAIGLSPTGRFDTNGVHNNLYQRIYKSDPIMVRLYPLRGVAAAAIGALLCMMAAGIAGAQTIVKWVDAQGQIHYSDHAPTGQETEAVPVRVSRPRPISAAPAPPSSAVAIGRTTAQNLASAKDEVAQRQAEEERRRVERQAADAAKAQADQDLIAKCNQAHEIYCNQGSDAIRQRAAIQAQIQYADAISGRQERISRGARPGAMPQPPP